jgi:hypothetical protein
MTVAKKKVPSTQQVATEQVDGVVEQQPQDQQATCGLIMPISTNESGSAEHWRQVRDIICAALIETDLNVKMVSESDEVNVIHNNIVTNVYANDIVICDVSSRNPNVMFELGMRLAFDKPVVIIKDRETPYTFDVGNIYHIEYPRSLNYIEILEFQKELKEKTLMTLDASQQPDYSPFLSNYKIKKLAGIEVEFVGKEEFMMSSLKEIMGELKRLNRSNNNRTISITEGDSISERKKYRSDDLSSMVDKITEDMLSLIFVSSVNVQDRQDVVDFCMSELNKFYPDTSTKMKVVVTEKVLSRIGL